MLWLWLWYSAAYLCQTEHGMPANSFIVIVKHGWKVLQYSILDRVMFESSGNCRNQYEKTWSGANLVRTTP